MTRNLVSLGLSVAMCVGLGNVAFGQRPADAKARGDAYSFSSGQTWGAHAYDHARILNEYSAGGQPVPKEVIQEHATAIRSNVEGAQRAYSKLAASTKTNAEAAKKVAAIQKRHAKVLEMCDMLDAECAKGKGDSTTVCSCCTDMEKELKAIDADETLLMKQLKIEKPAATVKK